MSSTTTGLAAAADYHRPLIQPNGAHGPAMAVEDAVVLGGLFQNLSSEDQIATFLNAYQEIREGRTTEVNKNEASAATFCRLPPGPVRDARNAEMRLSRGDWDDGSMKKEFEGIAGLFGYVAEDAAQVSPHRDFYSQQRVDW